MGWNPNFDDAGTEPETPPLARGTSPGDLLALLATVRAALAGKPEPEALGLDMTSVERFNAVHRENVGGTRATAPEPPVPVREHRRRAPRSDKGKPRVPREAAPAAPADDVLGQVLERIREARVALVADGQEPGHGSEDMERANLLLEEAVVIGEGRDVTEWLRRKVFGK